MSVVATAAGSSSSPSASSTNIAQKQIHVLDLTEEDQGRKRRKLVFTPEQDTYIAEQLMDPDKFIALDGPGDSYMGQRLKMRFYGNFAEDFNSKFGASLNAPDMQTKIHHLRWSWITTYRLRRLMDHGQWTESQWEEWIKGRCHVYYILKPALEHAVASSKTSESGGEDQAEEGDDEDDEEDEEREKEEGGEGGEEEEGEEEEKETEEDEGVHGYATRSKRKIVAAPAKKTLVKPKPINKGKCKATPSQTQSDEVNLLGMLKDLKDTSKIQREVEKEQTRREQLQFEERASARDEAIKSEQLRVQEATLRVEELRVREEEITKRQAIQAEVEKSKDQIRIKELEIEHTNRLLLLEETRLKRAIVEKENLQISRMKDDSLTAE